MGALVLAALGDGYYLMVSTQAGAPLAAIAQSAENLQKILQER